MTDYVAHRIEALPGDGRYTLTFRGADGAEAGAVAQVTNGAVELPASTLPPGWSPASPAHADLVAAVLALHAARTVTATGPVLRDVAGGWDVGLGNVELGADGRPTCTAHGAMTAGPDGWSCAECGARALLA